MTRAFVIANPKAGRGSAGRGLGDALATAGLEADIHVTERPGHGTELARTARERGESLVVAAGGDGTVHEVVNGLLSAEGEMPVLGVIPLGSGCDYVKTFGIPSSLADACAVLGSEREPVAVDAGEIAFQQGTRYFMNIAEVGIGPEVVARASRLPRALGGLVYLAAFLLTLPGYRRRDTTIRVDEATVTGRVTNLVIAIGRVFGGGMRVAPGADPSDGWFDVQIHTGSKPDYVRNIPKVFKGRHLPHPRISEHRASSVEVTCQPPGLIEADGEVLGTTPATFQVLPGALRLKV